MSGLIFSDPYFIRKNTLINLLYSYFPPSDFNHATLPQNYPDILRATYHNLSWENLLCDRKYTLGLAFQVLSIKSFECSDIDWFYLERCILHFVNFKRPVPQHIPSVLNRN